MIHGLINVNKEQGFTSHDVVAKLRGILKQKKIGHTGTLDPNATGVLPVCLGKGTKLCDMLTDTKKEYQVTFQFGKETDTEDVWGEVVKTYDAIPVESQVLSVIQSFVGEYDQVPPMYSAKKINGKKLYELAREGQVVQRQPAKVHIYNITDIHISLPQVTMTVTCSKGTYIRSLCRDIGYNLQNGAYMTGLIRTQASGFTLENARTLDEIEAMVKNETIEEAIVPIERMFTDYQKGSVKEDYNKLLYNGNPLKIESFLEKEIDKEAPLRVYDYKKQFIGIYTWKHSMFFPDKIFYNGN